MIRYTFQRFVETIPTLFLILTITFFVLRLAPGSPFDSDRVWPPEIQKNIEEKYGLNQPLFNQFMLWVANAFRGDLSESFQYLGKPITEILSETIPDSILLGAIALSIAITVGILLGAISALKRDSFWDWSANFLAIAGVSLPNFLVASLLILIFAFGLNWFPPALWEGPQSVVLPAITLALKPLAMIARLTRASLLESLATDYIRTIHAKGLPPAMILLKHALKNSMIPLLALAGPLAANLITGSFVVETVFQVPGLGKHFVTAVLNRDYPLVMGTTLIYGTVLLFLNLVADLLTAWVDPRIRLK